ncbi:MAG: DUF4340 domain-containing protein [Caldilineae bacterium]|nr:MAG: DUF4340 domain-containing protein [Caldilineae bacterium]
MSNMNTTQNYPTTLLGGVVDLRSRQGRWLAILAGLLVVQLVAVAILYWPRGEASSTAGAPLFPDFKVDLVKELTITGDNGEQVHFAKNDAGEWVIPEADGFPADGDKITELLNKIGELKATRLVARTASSYDRLQVAEDNFVRRIDIKASQGGPFTLYMGSSPQARSIHVRAGDQDEVYLALNFSELNASNRVVNWIDVLYVSLPQDEIQSLTLENPQGVFTFTKDAGGAWTMDGLGEGEEFIENNFDTLLTSLTSFNMVKPLGKSEKPEYGLDDPTAVITVVTRDSDGNEATHTIRVGAQDPDTKRYVVHASDSEYYVEVASYTVERFVERGRDNFVRAKEESAPDATPTP